MFELIKDRSGRFIKGLLSPAEEPEINPLSQPADREAAENKN